MAVSSVESVVNMALMLARRTARIADIFEGSENAKVALELYSQCRDELMRTKDWSFNRRVVALTQLKGPPPAGGYQSIGAPWNPTYPAPGFLYSCAYPSDCLLLRGIIPPPGPMPDLDPVPAEWRIDDDAESRVILCNVTNAMAIYWARVSDFTIWNEGFIQAIVGALSAKFVIAFGGGPNEEKETDQSGQRAEAIGGSERG